jgi:hypothetical protein
MGRRRTVQAGLVALCSFAFAGCTDEYSGRERITGSIKLKGEPIPDGAIVIFEPLEKQDTAANATVVGGSYTVPESSGLKPGKYLVRITAGDGKTAVNPTDPDSPPGPSGSNIVSKDLVPADWNVNSKQEVTVTKGGPNKFDFNIP